MHILVAIDGGVQASGLLALAQVLSQGGNSTLLDEG
jgi:hypothetical protein